jgi:hypothetical protein
MKMTWDNYVLYLASIPKYEDDESGKAEDKPEVKDAWDLF